MSVSNWLMDQLICIITRYVGLDLSKPTFKQKSNDFKFCKNKKQTKTFSRINSKQFHIYDAKKTYFIIFFKLKVTLIHVGLLKIHVDW